MEGIMQEGRYRMTDSDLDKEDRCRKDRCIGIQIHLSINVFEPIYEQNVIIHVFTRTI